MTANELELAYQQLHEQLLRGELSEDEFKAEVDQLRFTDDLDNQWKIGWYTGKWYRYEDGQWVQDKPPDKEEAAAPTPVAGVVPPSGEDGQRRSRTPYLVAALIILLLLASAALVYGWRAGWWAEPTEEATAMAEITPAASDIEAATETPALSTPTRAAQATPEATSTEASPTRVSSSGSKPSPTPSPSATRPRPTATAKAMTATPRATATSARATATTAATRTATVEPTRTSRPTSTAMPSPTAGTLSPTVPPPTAVPSLSGRIYFPVYDPNPDRRTFDIHVVELDSLERDVAVGQASQPAVTADGKRLAYRSWDSSQRGIWVLDMPNGNTWRWIAFHEAAHADWAPDGQNIVFASQQEVDRRWRIYRTWGLDSDRVRREGGDIFGRVHVWAVDGRIYYWECPMDKCGLYAMHGNGTNLTRLTGKERDTAPAVSPDGSQLAFMSDINGNWELYLTTTHTPAEGNVPEPRRLTQNPARDGLPVWSPDGRWLAFVSDRGGAWAVWAMRPDGSRLQKLFDLGGPLEGNVANVPPEEQHGWTWETLAWGP